MPAPCPGKLAAISFVLLVSTAVPVVALAQTTGSASTKAPAPPGREGGLDRLIVPRDRPRLWFTPERLARAKERVGRHPFRAQRPGDLALEYLLLGKRGSGEKAVKWLLDFKLRTDGVACDDARWYGEDAMLVFDWCHDLIGEKDRQMLIERWNEYLRILNEKDWGSARMPDNNYFWGYLRNGLEWGIATQYENPSATGFLTHAVEARYGAFVGYAATLGRGGVPPEGTQYGSYLLGYATPVLATLEQLGLDMWSRTDFFRDAVYYIIYASTPAHTARPGGKDERFEMFPFSDDEQFLQGGSAERPDYGAFMSVAAERWHDQAVGQYAQRWLEMVKPTVPFSVWLGVATNTPARKLSELPLDYYAPGPSFFYTRNRWGPDATSINLQLGRPAAFGHPHIDWGSFQLWRGGRWLTRETVAYGEKIVGWRSGEPISGDTAIGHNLLLFEGMGPRTIGYGRGQPRVTRLESRPDHSYAVVDMDGSYRCTADGKPLRDDNPYAKGVVREFLFVRPLEALVIFDRVEASSEIKPASEVVKTFILHSETEPKIDGKRALIVNGDQALGVWSLAPASTVTRVVKEGSAVGQYRLEIDASGSALTHFLTVLVARGASAPDLRAEARETPDAYVLTLSHPTKGSAEVHFRKGVASVGGSFGFAASGPLTLRPLREDVQAMRITQSGPNWE